MESIAGFGFEHHHADLVLPLDMEQLMETTRIENINPVSSDFLRFHVSLLYNRVGITGPIDP